MQHKKMTREDSQIATILTKIEYIQRDIGEIKSSLKNDYATKSDIEAVRSEFRPFKTIVYFVASTFGLAVVGALIRLIFPS